METKKTTQNSTQNSTIATKSSSRTERRAISQKTTWQQMLLAGGYYVLSSLHHQWKIEALFQQTNTPFLVENCYVSLQKSFELIQIGAQGLHMLHTPNAGGSSVRSEVLSLEILQRILDCKLLATEMDIFYYPHGSKRTDYSIRITQEEEGEERSVTLGVSVTRAMNFHEGRIEYTTRDAKHLLVKKLDGILWSTKFNLDETRRRRGFSRQILHVFAQSEHIANMLKQVYMDEKAISTELRSNTIVMITVAEQASYLFFE